MLGLNDPWIAAAYLFCLGSAVLCVGYSLWGGKDELDK